VVNLLVAPLMGVIVPLGFIGLANPLVMRGLGRIVAAPPAWLVGGSMEEVVVTHAPQDHTGPHWRTYGCPAAHVGRVWLERETAAPTLGRLKEVPGRLHVPAEHEM
jgi:hypothetical protein